MRVAKPYARGNQLWCRLKNEKGEWISKPTGHTVGQERDAKRYQKRAQANMDKRREAGLDPRKGPLTFRAYVEQWLVVRKEAGHDWKADRGRLTKHVLRMLGDHLLDNIRTVDIAELVHHLRFKSKPPIAQRTVHNIYNVVKAALRDAAIAGKIDSQPCILTDAQLGPIIDSKPEWRLGALFTRDEAEVLISDPRIPFDRRVVYAFGLLAGMRPGEIGALRWRHWDATEVPLGRLLIATSYNTKYSATKGTKTNTVKSIPIHPTLAGMLEDWRSGWAVMMGREPTPEDLIVPLPPTVRRTTRKGEPYRGYDYTGRRWRDEDLPMLGWRARGVYDTKSTFITLAIEDGANRDILRDRVTHTKQKRSAFDGYDRGPHWVATCAEVVKLRISRRSLAPALLQASSVVSDPARLLGSGGGLRTPDPDTMDSAESNGADEEPSSGHVPMCPQ